MPTKRSRRRPSSISSTDRIENVELRELLRLLKYNGGSGQRGEVAVDDERTVAGDGEPVLGASEEIEVEGSRREEMRAEGAPEEAGKKLSTRKRAGKRVTQGSSRGWRRIWRCVCCYHLSRYPLAVCFSRRVRGSSSSDICDALMTACYQRASTSRLRRTGGMHLLTEEVMLSTSS